MAIELLFDPQEAARQRKAIVAAIVAHALILGMAFLFVKWTPPDPPWTDKTGGQSEISFGTGDEGFGDIQALTPVSTSTERDATEGVPDKVEQEPQPQETQPTQTQDQPEEITSENTQETDSPIEVPPVAKQEPRPVKPVEMPKPEPKPAEPKPVVKTTLPPPPSYSSNKSGNGGTSSNTGNTGNNNGDRPGTVGDAGHPEGTMTGPRYHGSPGGNGYGNGGPGNGGGTLDMAGWTWDSKIKQDEISDESGLIVFAIKVDADGYIINVNPIRSTVSPKLVQFYKNQIQQKSFDKISAGQAPPETEGKITIVIRSR